MAHAMTNTKPTVLVTATNPDDLKGFFEEVSAKGYELKHFNIADQEGLLREAYNISSEGKPVAVICSGAMATEHSVHEACNGNFNGEGLATAVKEICGTPNLTIIYSEAKETLEEISSENVSKKIKVKKGCRSRTTSDVDVVSSALNFFFSNNQPV